MLRENGFPQRCMHADTIYSSWINAPWPSAKCVMSVGVVTVSYIKCCAGTAAARSQQTIEGCTTGMALT